jgi:N-methylhydantoinase B
VTFDVRAGLVTTEGARRYGVVFSDTGEVDAAATEKLRKKLASERGASKLFDRGGSIDELKARCKEETGLEPPERPKFPESIKRETVDAVG